jgi:hypothetical protein
VEKLIFPESSWLLEIDPGLLLMGSVNNKGLIPDDSHFIKAVAMGEIPRMTWDTALVIISKKPYNKNLICKHGDNFRSGILFVQFEIH